MNMPACLVCGERVVVSTTLLSSVTQTADGVVTLDVDTDLLTDIESDALRCGCDEGATLTNEGHEALAAVLKFVSDNYAPSLDCDLPEEEA